MDHVAHQVEACSHFVTTALRSTAQRADWALVIEETPTAEPAVQLAVIDGVVRVHGPTGGSGTAALSWAPDQVSVRLAGDAVAGATCRVPVGAALDVELQHVTSEVQYLVTISRDRMEAELLVQQLPGIQRLLVDASSTSDLTLEVVEHRMEPPFPEEQGAIAALQRAGVSFGVDEELVRAALDSIGEPVVVARGLEPIEGRNGRFEPLVNFEQLRTVGVLAETPLVRRIRKLDGTAGRDVTGRELSVPATKDVRLRPGPGVLVDEQGVMAVATVDGAPHMDAEGFVEVRHELLLEEVDNVSGDINFQGTVRISGSVHEGRRVIARDEVHIEGSVDRAHIESGSTISVVGSIMSSVLRAGGERAVAATIADRVLDLPKTLGLVAAQARQFRDQGESRGTEISHALAVQLVIERIQRQVLPDLASVVDDLREAGPAQSGAADRVARWHRRLSTAANIALTPEQFGEILIEASALADDVQRAIEQPADLVVSYMQACEAEATGAVTIIGKGIFNSRIVAWGGLAAQQHEAVLRGGTVVSHGPVQVREVGSPAGARTSVQLGSTGSLESDRVYAGTVVSGPGYTHRFVADRSHVKIDFDRGGSMNVESLAA
ncbi:MAG: hypothetical protein JWM90_1228 [Thermoleophilia bacterium]|nr:hypothetical protein [Thermoleophilia bacterium]